MKQTLLLRRLFVVLVFLFLFIHFKVTIIVLQKIYKMSRILRFILKYLSIQLVGFQAICEIIVGTAIFQLRFLKIHKLVARCLFCFQVIKMPLKPFFCFFRHCSTFLKTKPFHHCFYNFCNKKNNLRLTEKN